MADVHADWRDEEELVDYEPEEPPRFSLIEDDISLPEKHTPTPEEGTGEISPHADELPALLRRMTLWRGGGEGSARNFSGAARTPSPPQDPDLAEIDTDNHSLSLNNDVEMTGEPADARRKRRRGPEDGAAVDDESVDVFGRSDHGVEEADARSKSVGASHPVHGVGGADVWGKSVDAGRPVRGVPVHGMKEANAKSGSVGAGRPVRGVPVHGVKEADARSGSVGVSRPSAGSPSTG
jgi:hypothetical protein